MRTCMSLVVQTAKEAALTQRVALAVSPQNVASGTSGACGVGARFADGAVGN